MNGFVEILYHILKLDLVGIYSLSLLCTILLHVQEGSLLAYHAGCSFSVGVTVHCRGRR